MLAANSQGPAQTAQNVPNPMAGMLGLEVGGSAEIAQHVLQHIFLLLLVIP
jgi:hypothetical protein